VNWKHVEAEALRIVDEVAQQRSDVELTEYKSKERYRNEHPDGKSMHEHNAIVREAMREAVRRGIYCRRRLVE
jgi:hypothetical protein